MSITWKRDDLGWFGRSPDGWWGTIVFLPQSGGKQHYSARVISPAGPSVTFRARTLEEAQRRADECIANGRAA